MLTRPCTFILFILWITMAQIPGQENKEKTTALKDLLSRIDLDELMKKDEPPLNFPKTLEEFEYAFNEHDYFYFFQIITRYVYQLLETKCNLTKEIVPVDATAEEPRSFIYLSADAMSNPAKLLVLIQGCGVVRAGQWARRLIINQDLDSGTQIPFITRAQEVGRRPPG
ncbi:unnamed protein product [Oncorhynchus mykiss]|uniref:Arb2 domain-containing protein n=1 Tax=Oncorhynchus mykiss TaxID=8022 RepID=A0A060XDA5_ONCMY|nr:unnamed protein product [Oncorhynchus mykiss]